MKHITGVLVVAAFCCSLHAQQTSVHLNGRLAKTNDATRVYLENADGIRLPVPVDSDGRFSFRSDTLPKGFYSMGSAGTLYLHPGYQLVVAPDKSGQYFFTGKGAVENNALRQAKKSLSDYLPVDSIGQFTQAVYYMELPLLLEKLHAFNNHGKKILGTSRDSFFTTIASKDLDFQQLQLLYDYWLGYGVDQEKQEALYAFMEKADRHAAGYTKQADSLRKTVRIKTMDSLTAKRLEQLLITWDRNDETLFRNSSSYRSQFDFLLNRLMFQPAYYAGGFKGWNPAENQLAKIRVIKGESSNPYIIAYWEHRLMADYLKMAPKSDTASLGKHYRAYMASTTRADYRADIAEVYHNATTVTDHATAPLFVFQDISGTPVALESLRGKYVYIDVWATWCTPCKAEIPHLTKIEETYEGKPISFVSLSVDNVSDKSKWETYVKTHQLKGIQVMADKAFESDFIRKFNINSIPRFILIDPAGKIVAANALRPSNPELRSLLDKLL